MADMELYQGEVSPLILISPPNDGVTTTLDAAWACKLGIYNEQDTEKLSRTITLKQVSDIGQPEREYFSTFFTEIETAALPVGEYTIAVLLYETSTNSPPKYCKEVHKTLTISKGLVPAP